MREKYDLLGYLLDALDDEERDRIEAALLRDPQLQQELEALKECMEPLDEQFEFFEPPSGMADRTVDLIADYCDNNSDAISADDEVMLPNNPSSERPSRRRRVFRSQGDERGATQRSWGMADTLVAGGIFVAVAMIFFPAVINSRFQSRVLVCQKHLQELGYALTKYSENNHGYFPEIPTDGNRSVAGIYAPILLSEGYLNDSTIFICPTAFSNECNYRWHVPALSVVDQAQGQRLVAMQRRMGGSYGYTLGYFKDGRYITPRNEHRPYFALMSDAPSLHLVGHQSDNHGGLGQNVLFEDNHVRFISSSLNIPNDALFLNHDGFTAAGVNHRDSVIGMSFTRPILPSLLATELN